MSARQGWLLLVGFSAAVLAGTAAVAWSQSVRGEAAAAPWNDRQSRQIPDPVQGRFVALGGQFGELSYACVSCHELDGTGDRSGAIPRIAGQSQWYLLKTLQEFSSGARKSRIMSPIASELTMRDMQNVAAFYSGIRGQPFPPTLVKPPHEVIEQGRQIAFSGLPQEGVPACVSCHGPYGAGNAPLFPYLMGQFEPYLQHALHAFKSGERPSQVMVHIAKSLSSDQIAAVSAYFSTLRPEEVPQGATLTPSQDGGDSAQAGKKNSGKGPTKEKPRLGATMNPQPGQGDVVVPGASTLPRQR